MPDLLTELRSPDLLALLVAPRDLAPLLRAAPDLPPDWCALATTQLGERRLYRRLDEARGADLAELLLVRCAPLHLEFTEPRILAQDELTCDTRLALAVEPVAEPAELATLRIALLAGRTRLTAADLRALLAPLVRPLIAAFAARIPAAELIDATHADDFARAATDALAPVLFGSGLSASAPPRLAASSASLDRLRRDRQQHLLQRERAALREQLAALRHQQHERHLVHLDALLTRLRELAERSPDLNLRDLLATFPAQERTQLGHALLRLRPPRSRTRCVAVVSGEELILIDPQRPSGASRRIAVRGACGPLRSVRYERDAAGSAAWLLGARAGVYVLRDGREDKPLEYTLPRDPQSLQGGVNAATRAGDSLLATHSEVGLIRWPLDRPADAEPLLTAQTRAAATVRHVRTDGRFVWLTIDHRVLRLPADDLRDEAAVSYDGNPIPITALHVTTHAVWAGTQTGRILEWPLDDPSHPEVRDPGRGRPVESLLVLEHDGLDRLLFADGAPELTSRFLTDAWAGAYRAEHQTLRWCLAAEDLVAAVNVQRDRLILWTPDQPEAPLAVVPVSHWTSRSLQGFTLIPEES